MSGVVKVVAGYALMFAGVFIPGGSLLLAKAGLALVGMGLLEEASKLFTPSPPKQRIRQDVEYSGTVTPRRIVYGNARVGGLNTIRPCVVASNGKPLQCVSAVREAAQEAAGDA